MTERGLQGERFSPVEVVRRLKGEAVQFRFCHKYNEYDDYYTISYDPQLDHFDVQILTSVWDGRGSEESRQLRSEAELLEILRGVLEQGLILFINFRAA